MEQQKEVDVLEMARQLRNKKAKEWRDKNKEKIAEINKRYWINKAKKELEKQKEA